MAEGVRCHLFWIHPGCLNNPRKGISHIFDVSAFGSLAWEHPTVWVVSHLPFILKDGNNLTSKGLFPPSAAFDLNPKPAPNGV